MPQERWDPPFPARWLGSSLWVAGLLGLLLPCFP